MSQTCSEGQNPQGGFQHFDDISGAMVAVFQVAVPDSSYDILHIGLQAGVYTCACVRACVHVSMVGCLPRGLQDQEMYVCLFVCAS